ncbi:hypothetical protein WJX74_007768 [Apatococcus lobatus]|uniref:ARID domain-containing protein n=1 Tax=Apatococcus lobatus TaxID=904363 RepID=A0AAW1QA33_9CHLO
MASDLPPSQHSGDQGQPSSARHAQFPSPTPSMPPPWAPVSIPSSREISSIWQHEHPSASAHQSPSLDHHDHLMDLLSSSPQAGSQPLAHISSPPFEVGPLPIRTDIISSNPVRGGRFGSPQINLMHQPITSFPLPGNMHPSLSAAGSHPLASISRSVLQPGHPASSHQPDFVSPAPKRAKASPQTGPSQHPPTLSPLTRSPDLRSLQQSPASASMGSQEAPTRSQASPWRREPLRRSSSSGRGSVGSQRQGFQAAAGPLQDFHSVLGLTPSGKETHMDDGGWGLPLKRAPPRREATDMQPMAPGPEPQAPPSQSGFPRQSGCAGMPASDRLPGSSPLPKTIRPSRSAPGWPDPAPISMAHGSEPTQALSQFQGRPLSSLLEECASSAAWSRQTLERFPMEGAQDLPSPFVGFQPNTAPLGGISSPVRRKLDSIALAKQQISQQRGLKTSANPHLSRRVVGPFGHQSTPLAQLTGPWTDESSTKTTSFPSSSIPHFLDTLQAAKALSRPTGSDSHTMPSLPDAPVVSGDAAAAPTAGPSPLHVAKGNSSFPTILSGAPQTMPSLLSEDRQGNLPSNLFTSNSGQQSSPELGHTFAEQPSLNLQPPALAMVHKPAQPAGALHPAVAPISSQSLLQRQEPCPQIPHRGATNSQAPPSATPPSSISANGPPIVHPTATSLDDSEAAGFSHPEGPVPVSAAPAPSRQLATETLASEGAELALSTQQLASTAGSPQDRGNTTEELNPGSIEGSDSAPSAVRDSAGGVVPSTAASNVQQPAAASQMQPACAAMAVPTAGGDWAGSVGGDKMPSPAAQLEGPATTAAAEQQPAGSVGVDGLPSSAETSGGHATSAATHQKPAGPMGVDTLPSLAAASGGPASTSSPEQQPDNQTSAAAVGGEPAVTAAWQGPTDSTPSRPMGGASHAGPTPAEKHLSEGLTNDPLAANPAAVEIRDLPAAHEPTSQPTHINRVTAGREPAADLRKGCSMELTQHLPGSQSTFPADRPPSAAVPGSRAGGHTGKLSQQQVLPAAAGPPSTAAAPSVETGTATLQAVNVSSAEPAEAAVAVEASMPQAQPVPGSDPVGDDSGSGAAPAGSPVPTLLQPAESLTAGTVDKSGSSPDQQSFSQPVAPRFESQSAPPMQPGVLLGQSLLRSPAAIDGTGHTPTASQMRQDQSAAEHSAQDSRFDMSSSLLPADETRERHVQVAAADATTSSDPGHQGHTSAPQSHQVPSASVADPPASGTTAPDRRHLHVTAERSAQEPSASAGSVPAHENPADLSSQRAAYTQRQEPAVAAALPAASAMPLSTSGRAVSSQATEFAGSRAPPRFEAGAYPALQTHQALAAGHLQYLEPKLASVISHGGHSAAGMPGSSGTTLVPAKQQGVVPPAQQVQRSAAITDPLDMLDGQAPDRPGPSETTATPVPEPVGGPTPGRLQHSEAMAAPSIQPGQQLSGRQGPAGITATPAPQLGGAPAAVQPEQSETTAAPQTQPVRDPQGPGALHFRSIDPTRLAAAMADPAQRAALRQDLLTAQAQQAAAAEAAPGMRPVAAPAPVLQSQQVAAAADPRSPLVRPTPAGTNDGQEQQAPPSERGHIPDNTEASLKVLLDSLNRHWSSEGGRSGKLGVIGGRQPDLAQLYRQVCIHGGHRALTVAKTWKKIGELLKMEGNSLGYSLRLCYEKWLLSYEQKYFKPGMVLSAADLEKIDRLEAEQGQKARQAAARKAARAMEEITPKHAHPPAATLPIAGLHQGDRLLDSHAFHAPLQPQQVGRMLPYHPNQLLHPQAGLYAGMSGGQGMPGVPSSAPGDSSGSRKRPMPGGAPSGHAKKQRKTEQLSAQQQLLESQAVRAREEMAAKVQAKLDLIAPSMGPVFSLPADFEDHKMEDVCRALESGVPTAVAWSLDALALLTYRSDLLLSEHSRLCPALLKVVTTGMQSVWNVPTKPKSEWAWQERAGAPGDAQGWWWEGEEGLLRAPEDKVQQLTSAICASSILRSLALTPGNPPAMAGAVEVFIKVLQAQQAHPCAALNELSSNVLETLACIATALPQHLLLSEPVQVLATSICDVIEDTDSPLRLRAAAAAAVGGLAQMQGAAEVLSSTLSPWLPRLVGALLGLCSLAPEDAVQYGRLALQGDCGPLSLPAGWSQSGLAPHIYACGEMAGLASEQAVLACGLLLQAEAGAAAAQALHGMACLPVERVRDAVLSPPRALSALIQLMLWPSFTPSKYGPDLGEGHDHLDLECILSDAFSAKPMRSKQLGTLPASTLVQPAPHISSDEATAGPAATSPGQPTWLQGSDKPMKVTSKPPKQQRQRAAWLSRQYMLRMSVAAQHAAAILRASQKPLDGLSMYSAELVAAAMGAGEGLAGGLSIADSAAHLLSSLQPPF